MDQALWQTIFQAYQAQYLHILQHIYPAKGKTGFPERNLTVNFSKAYEQTLAQHGREGVSWFELQFGPSSNTHIDAVFLDPGEGELVLAESKRFSGPTAKFHEVGEDIQRIHQLAEELKSQTRIDMGWYWRMCGQ